MAMETPLKRAEGLGSAKEGTGQFWRQRLTGVASLLLLPPFLALIIALLGADYAVVKRTLANPIVAVLMLLIVLVNIEHMRIGMQVIIEDYVHAELSKITLLMLNTFFSICIGLTCVFAILKLSFGM
jgi:succinate dehydrogenase / fumarate reductase membrane anchor subunit